MKAIGPPLRMVDLIGGLHRIVPSPPPLVHRFMTQQPQVHRAYAGIWVQSWETPTGKPPIYAYTGMYWCLAAPEAATNTYWHAWTIFERDSKRIRIPPNWEPYYKEKQQCQ